MRSFVLVLCLALVTVACGDDDAVTTTTAATTTTTVATTTTEATTTTTTTMAAPDTVGVACVIGLGTGESVEVRAGAGDTFDLVGDLPYGATDVGVTGIVATNDADEEWTEIVFDGQAAFVRSQFLTAGDCVEGEAAVWSVTDITCDSFLNVRNGHGDGYDILGTLEPDAVDIAGTGVTAFDDQDRLWVQIEFEGGAAWAAGWFLTDEEGVFTDCSIPDFPWIITADAVGPIELGAAGADLEEVTGLSFYLQNSANDCEWYSDDDDRLGVEVVGGVISEIWVFDGAIAQTVEGFAVGDSKADAGTLYFGRATLLPGPFVGTNVVVDGPNYGDNWTYLFNEDPFDTTLVGTIRISPDGGYIEGGCT
jgi:hypothetical protein